MPHDDIPAITYPAACCKETYSPGLDVSIYREREHVKYPISVFFQNLGRHSHGFLGQALVVPFAHISSWFETSWKCTHPFVLNRRPHYPDIGSRDRMERTLVELDFAKTPLTRALSRLGEGAPSVLPPACKYYSQSDRHDRNPKALENQCQSFTWLLCTDHRKGPVGLECLWKVSTTETNLKVHWKEIALREHLKSISCEMKGIFVSNRWEKEAPLATQEELHKITPWRLRLRLARERFSRV